MTSLETQDGSSFNVGSFNRNQLSHDEYTNDKVDSIWTEAEFVIVSDCDENVICDDESELGDQLECIVSATEDSCELIGVHSDDESLICLSPFVESLGANAFTDEFTYSIDVNPAEGAIKLENEDVDYVSVDNCADDNENSTRRPESPVHFIDIEPVDGRVTEDCSCYGTVGDIQWTPVRVDENGFVHLVEPQLVKPVFVVDNASKDIVRFDGELIDVVGDQCEDRMIPTHSGIPTVPYGDDDAIEWLFRTKEYLRSNAVDDSVFGAEKSSAEKSRLRDANRDSVLQSCNSSVTASVVMTEDESDVDIETLSDTEQSRNIQRQYCDVSSIGALNILINYFHNYALPSIGPDQRLAEPRAVSSLKSRHHVDNTYSSRPRRKTFNWRTIDRVKSRSPPPLRAVSNKRTLKKLNNKRCAEESDVSDFQDEAGDRPELQKRTSHNRNERSRRRAMAVRFATLRNILPTVAGDPKASKMSVLNEAVLHIRRLETKLASNLEQLTALRDKHHALKDACEMQVHWKAASRSRSGRVAARDVRLQAK